ncbi:unnamed protein product [Ilex paraguariensis]|uniref:UBC core domain-containing protein n=1 Tax=Ilex paraguariensis TaxID=185542 RepID=A0ABC8S7A6_9AQUA
MIVPKLITNEELNGSFRYQQLSFHSSYLELVQNIGIDMRDMKWSLSSLDPVIASLLCDPNPNSPANSEAARMFSENKREYNRRVHEIVEQSWTAD